MTARTLSVLALMLSACTAGAAELERMFFTPAQRATLDNARKQNIRSEFGIESEQPAAVTAPVPQNFSVNGVIRRSDGKSTIWLNNRVVGEQPASGMKAAVGKTDNQVRLSVPESGRSVDLKVGQTVEIVSGTVEESYLRRPTAKPDTKTAPEAQNSSTDVANVTPVQPRDAVKSQPAVQKRPPRAGERDVRDDAKNNNGADTK